MAWTSPPTAVANATLTAATWNAGVRDNLNATAVALASAASQYFCATGVNALAARAAASNFISTSESTTTTSYTDLTTPGPSVTVTTGTAAFVWFGCDISSSADNAASDVSVEVSGSSSVAASDSWRILLDGVTNNNVNRGSSFHLFTGLTPGSNTFKMKYKAGSATSVYANREIAALPF